MPGIDETRRLAELSFDGVFAEPLSGGRELLFTLRDLAGWTLVAADTLGAAPDHARQGGGLCARNADSSGA